MANYINNGDGALSIREKLNSGLFTPATATRAGTIVSITAPDGAKHIEFTAPSDFSAGDTYRLNGTALTVRSQFNVAPTAPWKSGALVQMSLTGSTGFVCDYIDKATIEEAMAGTNNVKYVTPYLIKDSVGAFPKPSSNMGIIRINCKMSDGTLISGVQAYNISQYPGEIFISDESGIILIPLNPGSYNILLKPPIDCSISPASLNVISQYTKMLEYNITVTRLSSNVGFIIESGFVTISKSCTLDICTVGGGGGGGYYVFTQSRFAVGSGGGGGYVSNNTISYVIGDVLQVEVGSGGYFDSTPILAGKTTVRNLRTGSIVSTANGGLNGDVRSYDGSGSSMTVTGGTGNGAGGGSQYSSSAYKTTLTPAPIIGSTYEFGDSTRTKFGGGGGACGKDGYNNDENVSIAGNGIGYGGKGFNTNMSTSAPESIGQNGTGGGGGAVVFKTNNSNIQRNNMGYGGSGRASFRWR